MLDRVEECWGFPGTDAVGDGEIADVQPLWHGIQTGRSKPVFAYPVVEQDYLDFDGQSDTKHEYVGGYVYAMAGASDAHVTITGNLVATIRPLLRGKRCKDYSSDMRLAIPESASGGDQAYYYPDFFITCSEADLSPNAKTIKREPCLVVEVLSPNSTELTDRTEKLDNYRRIPSLAQYWLVDQDRLRIIVYSRAGAEWRMTDHANAESTIALPIGGLTVRLGDLYEKVFGM